MELYSKYHHLIEQTTQAGLWEYDYTSQSMRWSDYVYTIFNCDTHYQPTIEALSGFFMPRSLNKLQQSIASIEQHQQPFSGIFDITTTSGKNKTIAITMEAEFSGQTIIRRFGTVRDITQQHKQTIESEYFRERLELALRASAIGTWDYHVNNDNLYWDESMEEIFDLASYSSVTQFTDWVDLIHPEDRHIFIEQFNIGAKGLAENNTIHLTFRSISPHGSISFVRMNAQFYFDNENQNVRILGTCLDTTDIEISQQKIINQATLSQQNMLIAQNLTASRTRFLANMSHEIRTPMNAIMGALQILNTYDLDEDSISLIEMALSSSNDLLNIINDILDLSKIDANEMSIEQIQVQLSDLLSSVCNQFALSLNKNIDLQLTISPELNPYRIGDPIRITQIINNLVSNAIKFTHKGSIKISLSGDEHNIEIIVSDTGIGIPTEQLGNIFKPFKQADDSTTRSYGGTGLGLAICSSLTGLMAGTLRVHSEVGVGTKFIFNAPLAVAITPNNLGNSINVPVPDLKGVTIVIAEDNASNQLIIKQILSKTQANILIYGDGKQALSGYKTLEHVDLVITDMHMPVMNGMDMCKAIRQINSTVPILALTADVMLQNKSALTQYGFTDIISKPLQMQALYQFIHDYCRAEQV